MIRGIVSCLIQLIGGVGLLQPTPAPQTQIPKHAVTGVVTNSITGEPVRRALVQLGGPLQASCLTGSDGRFHFDDVPEGQVLLSPQKPGFFDAFATQRSEWTGPNNFFTIDSGKNDFQLKLYPSSRITGHVTDENDEPIEGAMVQVIGELIQQGRKRWQGGSATITDEEGTFHIDNLVGGRYVLFFAGHWTPPLTLSATQKVNPPLYYPDAADHTLAQPIDLQPGQEFVADFHARAERGYRVTARLATVPAGIQGQSTLTDATGQTVKFGNVHLDRTNGQIVAEAVPPGSWILNLVGVDQNGRNYQARQEFIVDHADIDGLQIPTLTQSTIPVSVNHVAAAPENPSNMDVNFQALLMASDESQTGMYPLSAEGDPPELSIQNVPPGKYKLSVQSQVGECLESALYGGIDLTRNELVLDGAGSPQTLALTLSSTCSNVKVAIHTNAEAPKGLPAYVVLVPTSGLAQPIVQGVSLQPPVSLNPEIQFTVPPGTYQVFAFSSLSNLEYANPEALRSYPTQTISLDEGQQQDLKVELIERKEN